MPKKIFKKSRNIENFEFINLQYGDTSSERELFKNKYGKEIISIKDHGEFELVSKYFSHFKNQINYQFETGSPYFDNLYTQDFIVKYNLYI